jgi:seryl-tRNA synthetase
VSDEFKNKEKMDYEQNKLINAQKRENEKLKRSLNDLGRELQDHEIEAAKTDSEVARLKDLSSKLKPAGELATQSAKVSADKIEAMLKDVEDIKNKPGMDDQKYTELKNKVDSIKTIADEKGIQNVQAALAILQSKQEVGDQMFGKVMGQLEKTQNDLEAKEKRFQKSIERNTQQRDVWGTKFKELNAKIQDIEAKTNAADEAAEQLDAKLKELEIYIPQVKQSTTPDVIKKTVGPKVGFAANEPNNRTDMNKQNMSIPMVAEDLSKFAANQNFMNWVNKYTPILLNMFRNRYSDFSEPYGDEQIIEQIHEYMPFLWNMDEVTNKTVNDLLQIIKVNLKQQGINPTQQALFKDLAESYEGMLDNIIGLPEIFKKV